MDTHSPCLTCRLCRVQLHTKSQERFQAIVDEAAPEHRKHLVWSPNLTDGSHCKVRKSCRFSSSQRPYEAAKSRAD